MTLTISILSFAICGAVVIFAGARLARYGDIIGERTGIGGAWVGSILLAGATSLPELVTDIAAIRLGAPDLAVGDLFGSSMANMLLLALVDLMAARRRLLTSLSAAIVLPATLALLLNAMATAFFVMRADWVVLGLPLPSTVLLVIYLLGTRAIYLHTGSSATVPVDLPPGRESERNVVDDATRDPRIAVRAELTLSAAAVRFAAAALAIVLVAPQFARAAQSLAAASGLGESFIGAWLVGLATSLPELASSVAAVRMGAVDLAAGNLFGSNALNMAIFFPLDLAQGTSIFTLASPSLVLTGLCGIILTATGLLAATYRGKHRLWGLEPDTFIILATYVLAIIVLKLTSGAG